MSASLADGSSVVSLRRPSTSFVLTYDDGPTPGVTDRLLPVLAAAGATATFFVLMTRVRASPALLREVLAAGHELGLHGVDHQNLTSLPPEVHLDRFRAGKDELEDVAGVPIRWSRPPYGAQDLASWRAARDAGLTPVLWSATGRDWEDHSPEVYLQAVDELEPEGCILLLHDGFADARDGVDDGPPPTRLDRVALTRSALDRAQAAQLTVTDLGRALEHNHPVHRPCLTQG